MTESKKCNFNKPLILPNSDPLGIKNITLGGAPPSLYVEAKIAERQCEKKNGTKCPKEPDTKTNR